MGFPGSKTVLIVNDSPDQREMMQIIFQQAGYRTVTASGGREAFEVAKSDALDLVISDVMMPDVDGIELCRLIRSDEKLAGLPILLFSGLGKEVSKIVEALEVDADDFIEMPIEPLHLIARAGRLIERRQTQALLKESESHFRSLIENISDIISVIQPDGTVLYQSPSLEQVLGYKQEKAIGANVFDLLHPDDKAKVTDFFKNNRQITTATQPIEYRFRDIRGDWLIFESVGKFVNDPAKGLVAIINSRDVTERRKTERALRESQSQLQTIFDNAGVGIALVNFQGRPIKTNSAMQQMLGYTDEEFQQMSFVEFTHPADAAEDMALAQEVFDGKRNFYQIEKRYIKKNGQVIWGNLTVSSVPENNGEEQFVVAMIDDISKRKNAEQSIFFQAHLLDTVEQAVIATDLRGIVIYWNRFAQTLYGWSAEEAIGRNIMELTTPAAHREPATQIMKQLSAGKSWTGEFAVRNKNAETFAAHISNTPVNDEKGQLIGVVGVSYDITERKKGEQSLRESEENFRALVSATAQYVWTIQENGESCALLEWWSDLTGLTQDEVKEKSWLAALHPEDRESADRLWREAFENRSQFDTSYRVLTKTGEYRHYAVRGVPVLNPDGTFRHWIGTFDDITRHKQSEEALLRSEEQLRQSQKLESVGRLAGGIAHDFNNMLTAINGYSELTLRKLEPGNPLRRNIEEIKKAGERSALLTNQLLAFSRRQVLQPVVLNLNEVITDTANMLERVIGEDIRLETNLDSKLKRVTGDPGQLTQVIMNLAVNARDAMPNGGSLLIETTNVLLDEEYAARHAPTKPGSYVMLAVADSGSGMDEETQRNIFEPFYTTKAVGKGTGLGLATVYGIVKQSGGFIWLDSQIDVGSTFRIYLPCIDAAEAVPSADDALESFAGKAATVLIVDDEDLVRTITRQALEELGYAVIEASDGAEALKICLDSDNSIELVITDVVMPQMNGRELAEKLAEKLPDLPILFTSGYTDDSIVRTDIIKADTNFIQKPFTFDALARKVGETLENKK